MQGSGKIIDEQEAVLKPISLDSSYRYLIIDCIRVPPVYMWQIVSIVKHSSFTIGANIHHQLGVTMNPSRIIRFLGLFLLVFTVLCSISPAWAATPINTDSRSVAIGGYDPVAYFTRGKAVKGSEAFTYSWMGAQWHFTSGEHREMFKSNPEGYAPQYGGY